MHLKTRNVNSAFVELVTLFKDGEQNKTETFHRSINPITKTSSRNGPVLAIQEPVIITFEKPNERVLFNQARDCNPFFHLFESLYMLSGGNLIEPLAYYAPTMKNYSDDGVTQNGAYGYRWKNSRPIKRGFWLNPETGEEDYTDTPTDQLYLLINHLRAKPDSRRAVLQMWNVEDDLLKMDTSKDICCNTSVMFSLRFVDCPNCEGKGFFGTTGTCKSCEGKATYPRWLDMTVINRSNDLVWGMLGANVVHFSFLQEYMAANLGVEVGVYNQMSNNLHIYTENNSGFKHEEWLADGTPDWYIEGKTIRDYARIPLVTDSATFEVELPRFVEAATEHRFDTNWSEPFLQRVATPLLWAFELHKRRDYTSALNAIKECAADDWRIVGRNWLLKRQANWEAKQRSDNATSSEV